MATKLTRLKEIWAAQITLPVLYPSLDLHLCCFCSWVRIYFMVLSHLPCIHCHRWRFSLLVTTCWAGRFRIGWFTIQFKGIVNWPDPNFGHDCDRDRVGFWDRNSLAIWNTTHITGQIPTEIGELHRLEALQLQQTKCPGVSLGHRESYSVERHTTADGNRYPTRP